jgi:hypothetical protein
MATTFTKIASVSVGVLGAASIDFTSIPSTYTDLCVKVSVRTSATNAGLSVRLNGDTGTNYSWKLLFGNGAATGSFNEGTFGAGYNTNVFSYITPSNASSTVFASTEIYLPNYAGSTNKSMSIDGVSENNGSTAFQTMTAGLRSNTAAITSVNLLPDPSGVPSTFVQYSTATLYGIKNS